MAQREQVGDLIPGFSEFGDLMEFQELISAIQEDFFQINRESKDMKELKDLYVGFAESHKQNFKTLQFHLKSKT